MGENSRIAIVWNHPSSLFECSFRFEQYLKGFEELGLDPVIVCTEASGRDFPAPLLTVEHAALLEDEAFWRSTGAEVVAAVTWHRMSSMLEAARRSGAKVLSIADTDGRVGLKSHPGAVLQRTMAYARTPKQKLRCLCGWLKRVAVENWKGSADDQEYLVSTECSDAVVLGNARAKTEFSRFLVSCKRPDLDRRVHVVPFTVASPYLATAVPDSKRNRVVAIGRWDDPQKDSPLLARALSLYLGRGPRRAGGTEVLLFGAQSRALRELESRFESVRYLGLQPADQLAQALADCRAIVFSSRWEGSPHAAFEALAMGASIVGPPIPCVSSWCVDRGFGTAAADRRPESLARALQEEMVAWDSGQRNARAIAAHWRAKLEPSEVCREMLKVL